MWSNAKFRRLQTWRIQKRKEGALHPLSLFFLPVGLGRLIGQTLRKPFVPVNSKTVGFLSFLRLIESKKGRTKGRGQSDREEVPRNLKDISAPGQIDYGVQRLS